MADLSEYHGAEPQPETDTWVLNAIAGFLKVSYITFNGGGH